MATRTAPAATPTLAKADGFLNLRVVAKDGTVHSFKTGIPLHQSRKLDGAILRDASKFTDALKEGRVTATVWVPTQDGESDIDL